MKYYILKNREPLEVSQMVWGRWFEKQERHVGLNTIGDVEVSTVFTGCCQGLRYIEGNPTLFETVVFGGEFDGREERYATYYEAEQGHERWVKKVKKSLIN